MDRRRGHARVSKATIDCVTAFGEADFRADMRHFKVPTLVIHGDADQTVPFAISGKAAAAAIHDARLVVYEGAPHAIPFTHAERLTGDLISFLRGGGSSKWERAF